MPRFSRIKQPGAPRGRGESEAATDSTVPALPFVPSQVLLGKLAIRSRLQRALADMADTGGGDTPASRRLSFGQEMYPHLFFLREKKRKVNSGGLTLVSKQEGEILSGIPHSILGANGVETAEQREWQRAVRCGVGSPNGRPTGSGTSKPEQLPRGTGSVNDDDGGNAGDQPGPQLPQGRDSEGDYLLRCLREPIVEAIAPRGLALQVLDRGGAAVAAIEDRSPASTALVATAQDTPQPSAPGSSSSLQFSAAMRAVSAVKPSIAAPAPAAAERGPLGPESKVAERSGGTLAVVESKEQGRILVVSKSQSTANPTALGPVLSAAVLDLLQNTATTEQEQTYLRRVRWLERQRQLNTLTSGASGVSWMAMRESERVQRTMSRIEGKRKRFRREKQ